MKRRSFLKFCAAFTAAVVTPLTIPVKEKEHLNNEIKNAISCGNFTIGSGGDFDSLADAMSALSDTLGGDVSFTYI